MIWTWIFSIPVAILHVFLFILPDVSLPSGVTTAFASGASTLNAFSFILPVGTIVSILALISAFYVALITWKIFLFCYSIMRGGIRFDV